MLNETDQHAFELNGFFVIALIGLLGLLCLLIFPPLSTGLIPIGLIILTGVTIVEPNEAKVITFLGRYVGTIRSNGFIVTTPFSRKETVSLKYINFNTETLKVNDLKGNPIEIAAVVVWHVDNAAKAVFNVDNYRQFIGNQSEIAVRSIAAQYPYDADENTTSLRGNAQDIAESLVSELQDKLSIAGITVQEVRISHLAYASEIAAAMLKRQQAEAVLHARSFLIEGALTIVDGVLQHFEQEKKLDISDDKKVELINNLLVTLTSDKESNPVLNVGT